MQPTINKRICNETYKGNKLFGKEDVVNLFGNSAYIDVKRQFNNVDGPGFWDESIYSLQFPGMTRLDLIIHTKGDVINRSHLISASLGYILDDDMQTIKNIQEDLTSKLGMKHYNN